MKVLLSGSGWQVKGHWPHVPHLGKSMELKQDLLGVTEWMEAAVPGGVHRDLARSGWIEDPLYGLNALRCEWVESRWWQYRKAFAVDAACAGRKARLVFRGLDYKAHLYLNRTKLGEHEGMYEPAVYDVSGLLDYGGENVLEVLLEHAPEEMGQIGYTSRTLTQKARFNYKWDFSTKLVNIGIWDDVWLEFSEEAFIEEVDVRPNESAGQWSIAADVRLDGQTRHTVHLQVWDGEELVGEQAAACWPGLADGLAGAAAVAVEAAGAAGSEAAAALAGVDAATVAASGNAEAGGAWYRAAVAIPTPKLWYPSGMGEQPLYRVRIAVLADDGTAIAERELNAGLRTLAFTANEAAPDDALPYTIVANGSKMYIKGVNLTPFDLLYGNVTRQDYEAYIWLLKRMNVNLVRIWGGGIIEKELFYELCDRHGILIWQEFIQSSSGIDNIPSERPPFLELLAKSARAAVRERRNHPALAVWSGGNELTDAEGVPATYANCNLALLKQIVEQHDPGRMFLPTSASGPREFLSIAPEHRGLNHDVHGPWKYGGPEGHYELYNESDSLLHSEFGADGCASYASLCRFLPPQDQVVTNMQDNLVWRAHGEWWDTQERDEALFGRTDDLERFTEHSQWTQAEGIRYALEANRRRKYRNSGSIVWQFNEPYPNVACTSLVDYYKQPKMAYYWARQAYAPRCLSLRYGRLVVRPGERSELALYMSNSLAELAYQWRAELVGLSGNSELLAEGEAAIEANCSTAVASFAYQVPDDAAAPYLIRISWAAAAADSAWEAKDYLFGVAGLGNSGSTGSTAGLSGLAEKARPELSWELDTNCVQGHELAEAGGLRRYVYKVRNDSGVVALYVRAQLAELSDVAFCGQNYTTLLPGQELAYVVDVKTDTAGVDARIRFVGW